MYSDRLIEIRKAITQKQKEINELKSEKEEIWKKILREINDNTNKYKKTEGLSGFVNASFGYTEDETEVIIITFNKNSKPSATALSNIEKDTGLKFKGNTRSSDNYGFGL